MRLLVKGPGGERGVKQDKESVNQAMKRGGMWTQNKDEEEEIKEPGTRSVKGNTGDGPDQARGCAPSPDSIHSVELCGTCTTVYSNLIWRE